MGEASAVTHQEKYLAVEFGGTHVSCAAVQGQQILERETFPVSSGALMADVLKNLSSYLHAFVQRHGPGFRGFGMGFCGLVDHRRNRIASTNRKYDDAASVDLARWSAEEFDLPFRLENDVRLALLGEHYAGAARGSEDVVLMTIGTGIGTAVMCEGRILRGRHSQAGILGGHFKVPGSRWVCSCGAPACYEAQASTFALASVCPAWPGFANSALKTLDRFDFQQLFRLAEAGDRVAQEIRAFCLETWQACALSLVHAYDPECLVIGGGVLESSFPILESIRSALQHQAWTPWGLVTAVRTQCGHSAALLGVTPLFQEAR